eukprot:CCRYP_005224-RA/>CCRYP_005224-RA protein AED:0.00 eAED:0.00 QI:280/-1/1/1/-1/1/1/229/709
MILKYNLYSIVGATALIGRSDAFTTNPSSLRSPRTSRSTNNDNSSAATFSSRIRRFSLNSDWDNGDFLSSLSGSSEDIQKANEKYNALSQTRESKYEWLARSMTSRDRPAGSSTELGATMGGDGRGGSNGPDFSQNMGQPLPQQQQPQSQPPGGMMQPPQQQQQQTQQPPQFYDQFGNPITTMPMVYDANGNLVPFNPTTPPTMPQPPQAILPPPPTIIDPPLPPKTKGETATRPVGYNPDAYTISNTADVYFAQLKQDSKVRKQAWLAGDVERANQVFQDETVKQIGESWVENPYTKEQNFLEARAQIEGAVRMQVLGGDDGRGNSGGISYRKKLEEMKAKRVGGGGGGAATTGGAAAGGGNSNPAPAAVANPAMPFRGEVTPASGPKLNVAPANPMMPSGQAVPGPSTPMATRPSMPVPSTPVGNMPQMTASTSSPATATVPVEDEEETRRKIRTLQGLLLKQRGGPGFGAGRLRPPEAQRLESTLEEVKQILRSEVSSAGGVVGDASPASMMTSPPSVMQTNILPKASTPIVQPPPKPTPAVPSSPISPDPMAGSVACVEAVLKMYKEASPSEREALLIPLREAFMAAAGASNKVIAEAELDAHKAAMGGSSSSSAAFAAQPVAERSAPIMGFPTSYNVAKPDPPSMGVPENRYAPGGNEENTQKLEDAYNALVDVSGGGKFGLRNISGNEVRNALYNCILSPLQC